jgi:hypothetical protein
MKTNMIRKTICTFFASAALLVIAFVIYATAPYSASTNLGDWILLLLPIVAAAFVNLMVYPDSKGKHPVARASCWGSFVGANGFLFLMVYFSLSQRERIMSDGTAYWVFLQLPAFWIGFPSLIIGAVVGFVTGFVIERRKKGRILV